MCGWLFWTWIVGLLFSADTFGEWLLVFIVLGLLFSWED